jgi:hypothetical protein
VRDYAPDAPFPKITLLVQWLIRSVFVLDLFDQKGYGFRYNAVLRPALFRATGFLILSDVAPSHIATLAGTGFFLGPPPSWRPLVVRGAEFPLSP